VGQQNKVGVAQSNFITLIQKHVKLKPTLVQTKGPYIKRG